MKAISSDESFVFVADDWYATRKSLLLFVFRIVFSRYGWLSLVLQKATVFWVQVAKPIETKALEIERNSRDDHAKG